MARHRLRLNREAALLASIAACFPVAAQAAPAARVDFAVGNVQAIAPNGQARQLSKGTAIEEGETVATNNGRAQLRFTDGAYVSLQPESEFRIDQYRFEGRQDGSERTFLSLLKGGLRTITGLVGRNNRDAYQVTTTVATIGIRGTEYTIQYGSSITGTVGEGEIEVCNGAGCLNVTNGEAYYVQNQDVKPVLTNKGTDLPPAPPENPPTNFAQGENVNENGEYCVLFPSTCIPLATLVGNATAHVATVQNATGRRVSVKTSAFFSAAGVLGSFTESGVTASLISPVVDAGNDGYIAWGAASGGGGGAVPQYSPGSALHYVAGVPVEVSKIGGLIATYSLIGATKPTNTSTGSPVGTLNSATLTADFGVGSVSGAMNWTISGQTAVGTFANGAINRTDATLAASGTVTAPTLFFSGPASLSVEGFFAGANAERAGIVYEVIEGFGNDYLGAAALAR